MKNDAPLRDQIDAYLLGQLNHLEQSRFQRAMEADDELLQEVEMRRLLFESAESIIAAETRNMIKRLRISAGINKRPGFKEGITPEKIVTETEPVLHGSLPWTGIGLLCFIMSLAALFFLIDWDVFIRQDTRDSKDIFITDSTRTESPFRQQKDNFLPSPQPADQQKVRESPSYQDPDMRVADYSGDADIPEPFGAPKQNGQKRPERHWINTGKSLPGTERSDLARYYYNLPDYSAFTSGEQADILESETSRLAIEAFQAKDFNRTVQLLGSKEGLTPGNQFLYGHAYYGLGAYAKAADNFELAASNNEYTYQSAAEWYGLLARVAEGDIKEPEIRERLHRMADDADHPYRRVALELGTKMNILFVEEEPEDKVTSYDIKLPDCVEYLVLADTVNILATRTINLIVRGSYEYLFNIRKEGNLVLGTIISVGGEIFNINDEFIFMNSQNERRSFRIIAVDFLESGHCRAEFYLDLSSLHWFQMNPPKSVFIKNNEKFQMLKLSISSEHQSEMKKLTDCFLAASGN